jgi:hypothetical protein
LCLNIERILLFIAAEVAQHCLPEFIKKQLVQFATRFLHTLQAEQTKLNIAAENAITQALKTKALNNILAIIAAQNSWIRHPKIENIVLALVSIKLRLKHGMQTFRPSEKI